MSSIEEAQPAKKKPHPVPKWWKNTYFWIAGFLLIVFVAGLIGGPALVRDPGQKREDHLVVLIYLAGAVVMFINGWISHAQTVREYQEEQDNG